MLGPVTLLGFGIWPGFQVLVKKNLTLRSVAVDAAALYITDQGHENKEWKRGKGGKLGERVYWAISDRLVALFKRAAM